MFKKEYKNIAIFVGISLLFTLSLILIFFMGNHLSLKYFELNDKNQIQLKGEFIDIEGLFNEERYTKEEIKKVKKCAKELDITPEEFVFVSLLTNGGYELNFENKDKINEKIKELEKSYQKDISKIYKDHCEEDVYLDAIIRAKLSKKDEIVDKEITIDGIFKCRKVNGIAPSGLLGADFTKVIIDDNIVEIGTNAFCSSNIQELYLGKETLKIGDSILSRCDAIQKVYSTRYLGEFTIGENNIIFNDVYTFVESD